MMASDFECEMITPFSVFFGDLRHFLHFILMK